MQPAYAYAQNEIGLLYQIEDGKSRNKSFLLKKCGILDKASAFHPLPVHDRFFQKKSNKLLTFPGKSGKIGSSDISQRDI